MCCTAKEVLARVYPGFQWPLETAVKWLNDGDPGKLRESAELLRALRDRYPNAPQIGQWLVLALIENRQLDEAETELTATERLFHNPDEELLCRWGRLFREKGDENVARLEESDAFRQTAVHHYSKARDKYAAATLVRQGHYPRINEAELSLILAGLDTPRRAAHQQRAEETAGELLETRERWPAEHPEDEFWHDATAAQCQMIRGRWEPAAGLYALAARNSHCDLRARESMRGGCKRTKAAFLRLGVADFGALEDEDKVFGPPAAEHLFF